MVDQDTQRHSQIEDGIDRQVYGAQRSQALQLALRLFVKSGPADGIAGHFTLE